MHNNSKIMVKRAYIHSLNVSTRPLLAEKWFELGYIIEDWHGAEMMELARLPLKPNMFHPIKGRYVSWREWLLEFNYHAGSQYERTMPADEVAMRVFRAYRQPKEGQTNFVFIVGERTLHNFDINHVLNIFPDDFDKILILEYPENTIPWNSLEDISVADARELWLMNATQPRWTLRWQEIVYATLKGKTGIISEFSTEEKFMRMLVFSDEEVEFYNSHFRQSDENAL